MGESIEALVAAAPLFRDLTSGEVADLAGGLELRKFAAGEALVVQGAVSDGAYVIAGGRVAVAARLPGGGESAIAEVGPGDLVGEMALMMRSGRRTATARAIVAVEALFIDRPYFEAALHRLRPASLKVLRRLGLTIAERLRALRRRSRALVDMDAEGDLLRAPPSPAPLPGEAQAFDVRAFLPILPCLRDFAPAEIDSLFAAARVETVARGATLVEEGAAIDAPRLVVRGALMIAQRMGDRICQLDILGPGRFAGAAPVLEADSAAAAVIAAEESTLLAFDSRRFVALWNGADRASLRLLEAVNADLVLSLGVAGNHLTRIAAQARARRQSADGADLDMGPAAPGVGVDQAVFGDLQPGGGVR